MLINNRVIHKDNATLSDISRLMSDPHAGTWPFAVVVAEDALYLGSDMPFNHRFFLISAVNAQAGALSVAVWDGEQFTACEDVQDFTQGTNGVPFSQSGIVRWALPQNVGWGAVYDSSEISELSTVKAKANYWVKITFSAAFSFTAKYVGFAFARDLDLSVYYKDLTTDRARTAYNNGTSMTNWESVHCVAAEEIIRDLRRKEIVWSPNQILSPEIFTDAACHKLAEIVYSSFGNEERTEFAQAKYREAMAKMVFDVDKDGDGRLSARERVDTGALRRV